jgi:hypothetical protein
MVDLVNGWGSWQNWAFLAGIVVILAGFIWAAITRELKAVLSSLVVIGVGVVVAFIAVSVPVAAPSSVVHQGPQYTAIFSSGTGTSSNLTLNSATHTLTLVDAYYAAGSTYAIPKSGSSTVNAASPTTFSIGVHLARSDPNNQTAGFDITVADLPTLTNATTGTIYSPIAYTAATSASPGVWSIVYTNGSLSGDHPSVNAPSVTTLNPDLLGVPAFSGAQVTLTFTLGGAGFHYLTTAYASYSFSIEISDGTATPAAYTVTITTLT